MHDALAHSILTGFFDLVLVLTCSIGSYLVDVRTGQCYSDLFTFYAS